MTRTFHTRLCFNYLNLVNFQGPKRKMSIFVATSTRVTNKCRQQNILRTRSKLIYFIFTSSRLVEQQNTDNRIYSGLDLSLYLSNSPAPVWAVYKFDSNACTPFWIFTSAIYLNTTFLLHNLSLHNIWQIFDETRAYKQSRWALKYARQPGKQFPSVSGECCLDMTPYSA